MEAIIWAVLSYLLGAVPFGVVISRFISGKDPRLSGSGNIGATNVLRTQGKKAGALTLAADALKGFVPVILAANFASEEWIAPLAGFAAFTGHIFPVYLGFKGGKGIATGAGVFLAAAPTTAVAALVVFAGFVKATKYVSLGSIAACITLPIAATFFGESQYVIMLALGIAVLSVVKHLENIQRILNGTESKLGSDK